MRNRNVAFFMDLRPIAAFYQKMGSEHWCYRWCYGLQFWCYRSTKDLQRRLPDGPAKPLQTVASNSELEHALTTVFSNSMTHGQPEMLTG